jgi:hypothetical protein
MSQADNHNTPEIEHAWSPFQDHIYAAVYQHENQALRVIEHLIEKDFLMDRLAILGKRLSKGDDLLCIYYPSPKEKMKVWGRRGLIWGALWGLIAGIIGTLSNPDGSGVINIQSLLHSSLAAIAYGAVVGGAMAAGAAFSQVAAALHRMGIPQEQLKQLEAAIKTDKYVIILHGSRAELEPFRYRIEHSGAELFLEFSKDRVEL